MSPIHTHEYFVFEQLQERQHEQEQRRLVAHQRQPHSHRMHRVMNRLGSFFIAFGIRMQRVE
ncbi:MAG: hypothetical protein ABI406_19705 [Ktedonobacteraceae bacterium]